MPLLPIWHTITNINLYRDKKSVFLFFFIITLINNKLFLPLFLYRKDNNRNINVHSVPFPLACLPKINFSFHMNVDANPKKKSRRKSNRCRHHGGAIQAFVVMAFLLSPCHAGLIAEGKVLGTKRFLLGRMWWWQTLLCGPNIAWAARPLWVTGDTQNTTSRSVLRALGGPVWDKCCFSSSSSSDQGHIIILHLRSWHLCAQHQE